MICLWHTHGLIYSHNVKMALYLLIYCNLTKFDQHFHLIYSLVLLTTRNSCLWEFALFGICFGFAPRSTPVSQYSESNFSSFLLNLNRISLTARFHQCLLIVVTCWQWWRLLLEQKYQYHSVDIREYFYFCKSTQSIGTKSTHYAECLISSFQNV